MQEVERFIAEKMIFAHRYPACSERAMYESAGAVHFFGMIHPEHREEVESMWRDRFEPEFMEIVDDYYYEWG